MRYRWTIKIVIAFLASMMVAQAAEARGSRLPITACQTITAPGNYYLPGNVDDPNFFADCIVITAPNVKIDLNGNSIISFEGNEGVYIAPGADHAVVRNGELNGYSTAIFVGANYATITKVSATHGYCSVDCGTGIALNNSTGTRVTTFTAIGPTASVASIIGGSGNSLTGLTVGSIFVGDSSGNRVTNSSVDGFLGLFGLSNGITLASASDNVIANNQVIAGGMVFGIGIDIGVGNGGNLIAHNTVANWQSTNGGPGPDVEDQNPGCGTDVWRENHFASSFPASCIH